MTPCSSRLLPAMPVKAKYVAEWLGANIPHHSLDLDEIQALDKLKEFLHAQTPRS